MTIKELKQLATQEPNSDKILHLDETGYSNDNDEVLEFKPFSQTNYDKLFIIVKGKGTSVGTIRYSYGKNKPSQEWYDLINSKINTWIR